MFTQNTAKHNEIPNIEVNVYVTMQDEDGNNSTENYSNYGSSWFYDYNYTEPSTSYSYSNDSYYNSGYYDYSTGSYYPSYEDYMSAYYQSVSNFSSSDSYY